MSALESPVCLHLRLDFTYDVIDLIDCLSVIDLPCFLFWLELVERGLGHRQSNHIDCAVLTADADLRQHRYKQAHVLVLAAKDEQGALLSAIARAQIRPRFAPY